MSENISTTPYFIHINEPIQTIHLSEGLRNLGIQIDTNRQELTKLNTISNPQILVESTENPVEILQEVSEPIPHNFQLLGQEEQPCIVQIVYPQELSLSPVQNVAKRGRPKKKKTEDTTPDPALVKSEPHLAEEPPKTARTRYGRLVKLPKHIEKDFKRIEINTDEPELQVSDFKRFEEKKYSKTEFSELHPKKRMISAQYKCPKCFKAYLGKNKMIQHLKKNPDHGPLPEGYQEFNFDVWNYLFDITQKCKSGQRGIKFCEELSNLLHNVQLLKSALFKTVTDSKNCVNIDKVLGNAIGLPPGKYKFDENELYKDVTVLKLITNSDFFKPNVNNKQSNESTGGKNKNTDELHTEQHKKLKRNVQEQNSDDFTMTSVKAKTNEICSTQSVVDGTGNDSTSSNQNTYNFTSKTDNSCLKTTEATELSDNFTKKMDVDNALPLPSDLLSENLLLHTLPNSRNSVDELMLTSVDNGSNLLDNSTSSDEVMNVDQFVNERFKKIIEPDIELSNTSLNLDLPSLEHFQFHTS